MSWFAISIIAALCFSAVNLLDKCLLVKIVKSKLGAIKILGLFSAFIFTATVLFLPNSISFDQNLLYLPLLAGVFEILYNYYYLKAIEKELIGYIIPIFALAPIPILFISTTFLGEQLQWIPTLAIFIVISGVALLSYAKEGHIKLHTNQYVRWIAIATILYSIHSLFLDTSLNTFTLLENLAWSRLGVVLGSIFICTYERSLHLKELKQKSSYLFFLSELIYLVSMYLFILALERGSVTYVTAIINIQPLFVFAASYLFWKYFPKVLEEKFEFRHPRAALASVVIIVFGTTLLNIS